MRKKVLLCIVGLIMTLGITACGGKRSGEKVDVPVGKEQENKQEASVDKKSSEEQKGQEELPVEDDNQQQGLYTISIYHPSAETGEIVTSQVTIPKVDAQAIWGELQKVELFSQNEKVLGVEVNEQDRALVLDLNKDFGEHLRKGGTAEEAELITSIVNTYLEAFQCDKMLLTEEGETLVSSHKTYETYMEKR